MIKRFVYHKKVKVMKLAIKNNNKYKFFKLPNKL